jgi:molybdopterin adenylyltransferase
MCFLLGCATEYPILHIDDCMQVCDRMMPGYGEQMRAISLRYVPTAVLSRQTAGLRGKSLILNLPGRPKSIRETIDEIFVSIPSCITLLEGPYIETHEEVVKAFRPASLVRTQKP